MLMKVDVQSNLKKTPIFQWMVALYFVTLVWGCQSIASHTYPRNTGLPSTLCQVNLNPKSLQADICTSFYAHDLSQKSCYTLIKNTSKQSATWQPPHSLRLASQQRLPIQSVIHTNRWACYQWVMHNGYEHLSWLNSYPQSEILTSIHRDHEVYFDAKKKKSPYKLLPKPTPRTFEQIHRLDHDQIYISLFADPRYKQLKNIHVINFVSIEQGDQYLNRIAAYIEKPGPYVNKSIPPISYHQGFAGHDYGSASLAKFFNQVQSDRVILRAQEKVILDYLLTQQIIYYEEGRYKPSKDKALISIVSRHPLTRIILQHELSHAAFFVNQSFRTYCHRFWKHVLSHQQRAHFRRWLSQHYYVTDTTYAYQKTLIVNEMQAYLTHSHAGIKGEHWLIAEEIGISRQKLSTLSRLFEKNSPLGDFFDP